MAIKSSPFGGIELSGEDAAAFLRQVRQGPTDEQRRIAAESIERGKAMAADVARHGYTLVAAIRQSKEPVE